MPQLESTRLTLDLSDGQGGHWRLEDFNLHLPEGTALGIMARQPGLASAVLEALVAARPARLGGVLLDGRELCAANRRVVLVRQKPERFLLQRVTTYLQRAAAASLGRRVGRAEARAWVNHNLRLTGIEDLGAQRLSTLSKHALARVELTRLLVSDAPLVCLDHLFDGLDEILKRQNLDLMLDLQARMTRTMLFATDDVEQAVLMSDRILCLDLEDGVVVSSQIDVNLLRPRARLDLERSEEAGRLLEVLGDRLGRYLPEPTPPTTAEIPPAEDSVIFMADWVASQPERNGKTLEKADISLGFIPLIDCAPLAIALEQGFFDAAGLNVRLSRESSWSNIQDKVSLGLLDGAQILAAMPIAAALDASATPLVTAMSLGRNGNAITVSSELWSRLGLAEDEAAEQAVDALSAAHALRREVERRRAARQRRMVFAIVAPHSSHNYLLRYWLACSGIDPDRDVQLTVVPPSQMVGYLAAGVLDGFCVGEPWNSVAAEGGIGKPLVSTWQIWNNHPEKVLGVTRAWADAHPNTHRAMIKALLDACWWLDKEDNRASACEILSHGRYVNVSQDLLMRSLGGTRAGGSIDAHQCFHAGAANFPWHSHAAWLLGQMVRWGQVRMPRNVARLCADVYRSDIYRQAAAFGDAQPPEDWKPEGAHAQDWTLDATPRPLCLGPDQFMDGRVLDGPDLDQHLAGYDIPPHAGPQSGTGHAA